MYLTGCCQPGKSGHPVHIFRHFPLAHPEPDPVMGQISRPT